MNWQETLNVIPNGIQTESKKPSAYIEGVYPYYIESGNGAYISDGIKNYIDYPLGLGAIILGHANEQVNLAVLDRMRKGILFPIPNELETVLAKKISDLIPCAEQVRFLKTGSEACTAAAKIARAYTGKTKIIKTEEYYHGWHPCLAALESRVAGIPKEFKKTLIHITYNNIDVYKNYTKEKDDIAAVFLEPYRFERPLAKFLPALRNWCTENNILLVFDEIVTGFRTKEWSAQKYFGVTPDLCMIGKAMANGLPISAVCGKREIMEVLKGDCFVSSTFGGELASIAAALKTIEIIENEGVIDHIWRYGQRLKDEFNSLAEANQVKAECVGFPCRTEFRFQGERGELYRKLFWQECLKNGVFFGKAQFVSFSHGQLELDTTIVAMSKALEIVRKYYKNPAEYIGK